MKAKVAVVCAVDLSFKALLSPQMRGMEQAGYKVTGICSDGEYISTLRQQGMNIATVTIHRKIAPWDDVKAIFRLAGLFKRLNIDIVHTHTPKAAFLGQIAARLARVPVRINTLHGLFYVNQSNPLTRWLFKKLEIFTCKLSSYVLSQSREDIDYLLRQKLLPPHKMRWLGNGIDLEKFNPKRFPSDTRQNVRNEFDVPQDAFVVGILARMVYEKGIRELFEAFSAFRRKVPNAYLLHIGFIDRSRNEEITPDVAEDMGVAPYCRFLGQRDDVPRLMTAMDFFVLPSHREGYPRSVMEANAMGLPAIVTDIRGCREAVIDGENGLLVPVRNSAALCQAMCRLHDDAELRKKLSRGARDRAENAFDERRVIRIVLETYDTFLCSPHSPGT